MPTLPLTCKCLHKHLELSSKVEGVRLIQSLDKASSYQECPSTDHSVKDTLYSPMRVWFWQDLHSVGTGIVGSVGNWLGEPRDAQERLPQDRLWAHF